MINKDINIKVLSNSMIILDKTILGITGENLQGKIIFNFEKFIDGVAWLEIEKETGEKGYIQMTKENETYTLEIKSSLLNQAGYIYMQLRITQDENVNGIPVFKSKKFYVEVLNAINATATIEDDYPSIIDIVNTKQDKLIVGENITIKDNVISANIEGTVNKTYVDEQDAKTLSSAKQYANEQVPEIVKTYVEEHKDELKGDKGDIGPQGPIGEIGPQGATGPAGKDGVDGKSAYETWLELGNEGTEQDFLDSFKASGTGEGSCLLTEVTITIDENGGEATTVPVTKLELDYTSVELEVGQGMQLACSVIPSNATNNAITWSSSDSTKVKVEEGYITALSSGNATITAKSVENSSIKASCSVKVTGTETGGDTGEDETIEVTSLSLDKTSLSLKVDETATLKATVLPTNATNKNVVWSSSDNSKATVSNGVVTALAEGNVTITARSQSNTSITATCSVTIEAKETGGETTGEKVYLYDLSPVKEGSILKKDGKTEFAVANGNYYSIPYSEGMYIITGMNRGWVTNYPPIIVEDGGTITIPETTKTEAVYYNPAYGYSATLTGFSENAKVYVNTYYLTEAYREKVYYIVGGAE